MPYSTSTERLPERWAGQVSIASPTSKLSLAVRVVYAASLWAQFFYAGKRAEAVRQGGSWAHGAVILSTLGRTPGRVIGLASWQSTHAAPGVTPLVVGGRRTVQASASSGSRENRAAMHRSRIVLFFR